MGYELILTMRYAWTTILWCKVLFKGIIFINAAVSRTCFVKNWVKRPTTLIADERVSLPRKQLGYPPAVRDSWNYIHCAVNYNLSAWIALQTFGGR